MPHWRPAHLHRTSVYKRVVAALAIFRRRGDLFAIVSANETRLNNSAVAQARESLNPEHWEHDSGIPKSAETVVSGLQRQWSKLDRCRQLIKIREQLKEFRYDWVVRARPDVVFSPLREDWYEELQDDTVYRSRNSADLLIILPRAALDVVACGWRVLVNKTGNDLTSEVLLRSGFGSSDTVHICDCAIIRPNNYSKQSGPRLFRPTEGGRTGGVALSQLHRLQVRPGKLPPQGARDVIGCIKRQLSSRYKSHVCINMSRDR